MILHSGIGAYIRGLLQGYEDQARFKKIHFGLAFSPSIPIEANGKYRALPFRSPIYSIQEQWEYPFLMRHCRLWHAPHYNVPFLLGKSKLVVTIHDLIHWIFRSDFYPGPKAYYAETLLRTAIRRAAVLIAVSEKTKQDLMRCFGAPENKIRVIYEGVSPFYSSPVHETKRKEALARYGLSRPFFLYIGLIKPHKNIKRLVAAYEALRDRQETQADLVLVGKKDRSYPTGQETLKELRSAEGVHYFSKVDHEEDLHSLYASALALVHPSLYEGFGLTVLEAMASGTPVIVSRAGSLPEVAGEAGYYVEALSEDSIAQAMAEVERSESLRKNLIVKGRRQAQKFDWRKTAEETLNVYEEVLKKP